MDKTSMGELVQYVRERDEAVRTLNVQVFKDFIRQWNGADYPIPSDEILEITMRKMAVHSTNLPKRFREEAAAWLLNRGYDLDLL